ncbi:putative regulatory protein, FmdB family [Streptosporangium roseum DSM 43021]|uniref:Regulatory protein, FmdB family n=1 Tax=Streptosporangium roseum (strain ATCC 12428 / DSM 43021 / JCM 3005 / KCTC 9067 / NCIMB 10171 / NRRL 2505 / NI 9100) TaxID=479432 RepID=D2B460_STRRD|nr:FmdB family zinc ribbon protein [Streptosporangium roseum]ACZ91294.1 putative regulatory protein, FmdB family [Streptosporangium roseum DSM 43021]
MPTYQYACSACGNEFDIVQKFSDDALTECPTCSGELRKVFSAVGIVFKGSGFYRTDSRSSSTSTVSSGNTSSSSSSPAASGSSGSSTESASSSSSSSSSSSKTAKTTSSPAPAAS